MAVCITFNSDSPCLWDSESIPNPAMALSVRLLWSHFCPSTSYDQFACLFTDFQDPSFRGDVIGLLLADAGDKDIILCVDELMYIDPESTSRDQVTPKVSKVLRELGTYIENHPRIHVAFLETICWVPSKWL